MESFRAASERRPVRGARSDLISPPAAIFTGGTRRVPVPLPSLSLIFDCSASQWRPTSKLKLAPAGTRVSGQWKNGKWTKEEENPVLP